MLTLAFPVGSAFVGAPRGRQVNVWKDEAGRIFARAFADGDRRRIDWSGLGVFTFVPGERAVQVWPEVGVRPALVQDMFARVIQPLVLQAVGWQALHASGVRGPAGALVFCGLGRSGKSTLAFAAGRVPAHTQIADDAVVIAVDGAGVHVHPVPFYPKLRQPARAFFRDAAEPAPEPPRTTGASHPNDAVPLRAVVVLCQDTGAPGDPRLVAVSSAAAFSSLLRHAHCFDDDDPVERKRLVEAYLAIAECVPVYDLRYRPDFRSLPNLAATALRATSRPASPSDNLRVRLQLA